MKLYSLLPLLLVGFGATACAAAPADGSDDLPSATDIDIATQARTANPPAPVSFGPLPLCLAPPADDTRTLGAQEKYEVTGTADADTCDRFVLQVDGVLGGDVKLLVESRSVDAQGIIVPDAAHCAESRMTASARGQLPDRFIWQNGHLIRLPGEWKAIETTSQNGVWVDGYCRFSVFQQGSDIAGAGNTQIMSSPYARIQLSTRSVIKTAAGDVMGAIKSKVSRTDF